MSTLKALLAGFATAGTWWVMPMVTIACPKHTPSPCLKCGDAGSITVPALQSFRATCLSTGRFKMAGGGSPQFDPATARYATSDMVANVAAHAGVTIRGDVASSRALLRQDHAWKEWLSLDDALAHPHLGKSMPSREVILAAYDEANLEA